MTYMIDRTDAGGRRNGKTFRALMASLLALSGGKNVVYIGRSTAEVERAYRLARNILDASGIDCRKRSGSIQINDSTLYFKCGDDRTGLEGIKVLDIIDGTY